MMQLYVVFPFGTRPRYQAKETPAEVSCARTMFFIKYFLLPPNSVCYLSEKKVIFHLGK